MMELIRSTCLWGKDRYKTWIIAKAGFTQYTASPPIHFETNLLKSRGPMAVLVTDGFCAQGKITQSLSITMARAALSRPHLQPLTMESVPEEACGYMQSTVFTQAGLNYFLKESGDVNPIHRTDPPIVPGLWILQRIYSLFQPTDLPVRYDISFRHPLFTGQHLFLCQSQGAVTGVSRGYICLKLTIKYEQRR